MKGAGMATPKGIPDDSELRRLAEEALLDDPGGTGVSSEMPSEEAARLIHELQVHQTELKMQNDELRRIQGELENARDRYLELYDFSPSGYVTLSPEGMILEANLTCSRLLGCERSRLIGQSLARFVAEDAQDNYYFLLRDLLRTKAPQACESKLKGEGIEPFHAGLDCVVKERNADDVPHILVAITDMSEREKARKALQESHYVLEQQVEDRTLSLNVANEKLKLEVEKLRFAEEALRESEEKYRSLVESTEDSVYLVDRDCSYLYMNLQHKKRIGLSSTQIVGTPYGAYHSKQETQELREKIEQVFETGKPLTYEYHSKREERYCLRTISPVMAHGKVQAASVISKDTTLRKQAEMEAQRSRLELAHLERLATMGELTAALVHELSQPLTAILSNAQAGLRFIRRNPPELGEVQDILRDIIEDDRRTSRYIKQLRTFFKKDDINPKAIRMKGIIRNVVSLIRNEPSSKRVSIRTTSDIDLPAVKADAIYVRQILLNLTLNALDSLMQIRRRPRTIVISTTREDESFLKISIRDSGTGIDPTHSADIFRPYFTTKKDGMGMGLAICRSIIEAHGGRIWAESNPDHGATFSFTLPIAGEHEALTQNAEFPGE